MKYRKVIEKAIPDITEDKKHQINDILIMLEKEDY